jgi:predicted DNA-binding transcriptional regulator AlpA
MPTYQITLSYENIDVEDLDQLELIAAEAPNAHINAVDGNVRVVAIMAAHCATEAVEELVDAVHRADETATPVRAELELVAIPDIASKVGLNREAVRLWTTGKRGPGEFPPPLDVVGDRMKVWAASDVHDWLVSAGVPTSAGRPLDPSEVTDATRVIVRKLRGWSDRPYLAAAEAWHSAKQEQVTVPVRSTVQRVAMPQAVATSS